ncbi:carboxypeptidase inhibitor SmCI-like [Erythrolamprus reginae]|uniref:carboxypeptidase inhibitor SmCI-like n=1 Tax=Erythrolamprus reginae TaxID=121349 RepID=UPI00396C38CB
MQNWGTLVLIILLELNISVSAEKVTRDFHRICKLPPQKGKCNEEFENFYYDYKSDRCKTFIYGGCGGNRNNFVHLLECYYTCKRFGLFSGWENMLGDIKWRRETPRRCKLSPRKGKCKDKIPRYYYDAHNKRCRLFTYSGCGANENNFETFSQCNKACDEFGAMVLYSPESMLQTCEQTLDVGPCSQSFPRFYYNNDDKTCIPFTFGGCNGNRNNFLTQEKCLQECNPKAWFQAQHPELSLTVAKLGRWPIPIRGASAEVEGNPAPAISPQDAGEQRQSS